MPKSRVFHDARLAQSSERLCGLRCSLQAESVSGRCLRLSCTLKSTPAQQYHLPSQNTLSPQVARLGVPYSLMHRRGDPSTMTLPENTAYADVAAEVGFELQEQAEQALAAGIESWRMLLDPGADCFRIDVPGLQKTRTIQFPRGSRCSRAGAGRRNRVLAHAAGPQCACQARSTCKRFECDLQEISSSKSSKTATCPWSTAALAAHVLLRHLDPG